MSPLPERLQPTVDAVFKAYEDDQESGFRYHLGASLIGTTCDRSLWYSFRWASLARFVGRMLRLFQTGHLEESRFVAELRRIGVEIHDHEHIDPSRYVDDYDKPVKQIGVRNAFGHFGGSLDGMAIGFLEAPKKWHVVEFKTHSAKSFKKLEAEGVRKSKPRHFAQMQVYMHFIGATRAFYMAKNKDTDALYSERINYDAEFAIRMDARADRIIQANEPPRKISNDPSWFECRYCDHAAVCHGDAVPARHCRSCLHSTPCFGGVWACQATGELGLSRELQESGCDLHRYIPGLIHGEQIDAAESSPGNWMISYLLKNGQRWIDGGYQ